VLRYFVLSSHYRGPINYSLEQLEQADSALSRIYTALRDLAEVDVVESEHSARFREVMDDDFNTPEAIAVLQNMTREINSAKATGQSKKLAQAAALGAELRSLSSVLGLAQVAPEEFLKLQSSHERDGEASQAAGLSDTEIEQRIADRIGARKAKNWAESDRIRDELVKAGVILEDKPGGTTTWRRA
jgi:cysteinyl-tRNA synthetase